MLAGRYRLIEPIGGGPGGPVWRCHDDELDAEIAVKLVPVDADGAAEQEGRLRDEARRARRVTHPNVSRVFEFGSCASHHYLTMEYIPGESLHAWLERNGPMRPVWVQALAMSLCRGLAAALAVDVVHGMIRPVNILLAPGRGVVLTAYEIGVGGPRPCNLPYLAPERLHGGEVTPRGDVFAVGVVLFQALTGRLPWRDVDDRSAAPRVGGEPQLRALARCASEAWRDLIRDCLAVDPAQRPADVRSLLIHLGAVAGRELAAGG